MKPASKSDIRSAGEKAVASDAGLEINLSVSIGGVTFKNPVTTASGTFGSGAEFEEFVDLSALGAVTTKGVASHPWEGNPTPRLAETYGGMLNAVGLQNPGIELFCKRDIPYLKEKGASIIVNVCGHSEQEYLEVVERLSDEPVDLLEINVSCPNVKEGGIAFGQKPEALYNITKAVKARAKQPLDYWRRNDGKQGKQPEIHLDECGLHAHIRNDRDFQEIDSAFFRVSGLLSRECRWAVSAGFFEAETQTKAG